ncbi:MAG: PLP-dependent aminotransferase family protein [Methylobacteriaceae bacterium]|nr:PLP-dependent aminotransferase family protein [Methylobacteriaceae bacterium]
METSFHAPRLASGAPQPEARHAPPPRYNFIGGHNDPAIIPGDALAEAAARVIRRQAPSLAMYHLGQGRLGYPPLREFVARKLAARGVTGLSADDIMITSGSGQSIDLVNQLFVGPGDTVLIEEFSYSGAIVRARSAGARVIGMPLDSGGLRIDALERCLADLASRGVTPKYIYTIPTVQNPTGSILPLDRRRALIALSHRYGVPIFEDECYADLTVAPDAPPALHALAPRQIIHIGSFSKSLAPALRLGYATADWSVLGRMSSLKGDGGTGALDQMVAAEFLGERFEAHVGRLRTALRAKLDTMIDSLEREFGASIEVWRPEGGIFVWMRLAGDTDVRSLLAPAAAAGLVFNAGPDWACDPESAKSWLRLCFALPDERTIRDGVATFAQVCFEQTGSPRRGDNRDRAET